ncbi:related to Restin (intermediate filament-associated protein) [Melanopsichium pennsylvanicum]|uniref:Related to Restin (Intermediate filament-associated protein) n=2 Tax=Melanopsichium pennsylvanicum TaxID=63383 RepID=A0AAJ4XKN9_9BASI|nr:related to Restin (intermediate filament-associated protein) [Melanopsichium pennsylvanicum 4]SNX84549.1 related to Restin (intermediate filament-associated protein) [Melanopsichium pennsylvanicum]
MSGIPTTPNGFHLRSGLPTPPGARRTSLAPPSSISPGVDSPNTRFKKETLAEAISKNDPAKYRLAGSSPSVSSPAGKDDSDADNNSPLLQAGRLPRASLLSRKSHSSLRSETPPTGITPLPHASPSASDASPGSGSSHTRGKSPLPPIASTSRLIATPRRHSDLHSRSGIYTPGLVSRTPSHTLSTAASRARETAHVRRGRELEIGDVVRMEGSELVGVLRHLGPVDFKPGFYAGLELTGDSVGKGKNDGSVQGTQYFACAPGNGVFCPASKVVAINDAAPTNAVARPASSMSNRPSSRASDLPDRSGAITPSRRRAGTISRPPSTTPSRASSRISVRPPSVTPGSRPTSALATSRPASRLTARKSLAAPLTKGDDQDDTLQQPATAKLLTSPIRAAGPATPSLAGRTPRSSLAGVRAASSVLQSTPSLAKKRQSLGGIPTPRATKGRASMFARPGGLPTTSDSSMPPPPSPSKDNRPESASSVLSFRSNSRLGRGASDLEASPVSKQDASSTTDSNVDKNRMLWEQMDLTPRKSAQLAASRSQSRAENHVGSHDGATALDDLTRDSVAEAVVPLSLYEEQVAEFEQLRNQVQELEKQNAELRRAQEVRKARISEARSTEAVLEAERAKMRAQARERQAEMEEERRIERKDEVRRRKEIEEREKELREKLAESQQQLGKSADDHERFQQEAESRHRSLQAKLEASERLVTEMKNRIEQESVQQARGETKEALETQLKLKDAEIDSLKASLKRMEDQAQTARDDLTRQIDELKDAGRETISLYEQRIEEIEAERIEVLDNMQLLQDKAQEAIRAAETRVEELQAAQSASRNGNGFEAGSAAAIDNGALQEQVAHLQDKLGKYEDQISEAALALEKEKGYAQKRREKSHEVETSLKNELRRVRVEVERAQRAGKDQLALLEETRHALQESQQALECERAELEGLRADAENFNALKTGHESASDQNQLRSQKVQLEAELEARDTELRQLRLRLASSPPTAKASDDAEPASLFPDASLRSPADDRRRLSVMSSGSVGSNLKSSPRLSSGGVYAASDVSAASSVNQISGLSYLVRQLSDENNEMKTKHKSLESDLKARAQDAETKSRALELTVESLRKRLEGQDGAPNAEDTCNLAERLAESEARLRSSEKSLADLKSTLEATKMERKETADSLQKEVSQLEALVEARILREEELMAEVERLARKLDGRTPVHSLHKWEAAEPQKRSSAVSELGRGTKTQNKAAVGPIQVTAEADEEKELDLCGLCSQRGHTVEHCDKLLENTGGSAHKTSNGATAGVENEQEPCDDCGEVGHRFEDCPYAAEIF